jgi:hypothetical protein
VGEAFHAIEGRTAVGLRGAVRAVAGSVEVVDGGGVVEGWWWEGAPGKRLAQKAHDGDGRIVGPSDGGWGRRMS